MAQDVEAAGGSSAGAWPSKQPCGTGPRAMQAAASLSRAVLVPLALVTCLLTTAALVFPRDAAPRGVQGQGGSQAYPGGDSHRSSLLGTALLLGFSVPFLQDPEATRASRYNRQADAQPHTLLQQTRRHNHGGSGQDSDGSMGSVDSVDSVDFLGSLPRSYSRGKGSESGASVLRGLWRTPALDQQPQRPLLYPVARRSLRGSVRHELLQQTASGTIEVPRAVANEEKAGRGETPLCSAAQPCAAGAYRLLADGAAAQAPPTSSSPFVVGVIVGVTCAFVMLAVPLVGYLIWRFRPGAKVAPGGGDASNVSPNGEEASSADKAFEAARPPSKPLGRGRLDPILSEKVVSSFADDGEIIYEEQEEGSQEAAADVGAPSPSSAGEEPPGGKPLDAAASSGAPLGEERSASEASLGEALTDASPAEITAAEEIHEVQPDAVESRKDSDGESSIEETSVPEIEEVRKSFSGIGWKSKKQLT